MSFCSRYFAKVIFFLLIIPAQSSAQLVYPGSVDFLDAEETVFDWSADSCEQIDIPDAPARFFRDADGKIQVIAPHFTNYRMIGDDFNSLVRDCSNGPILSSHKNHDPAMWNDHEWILGTYTTDGKNIHAIIHNEFHGAENTDVVSCPSGDYLKCWYNGLTYASSSDTGRTFTHATAPNHFVATIPYPYEPDIGPSGIFGGSNIVKHPTDGYYYVLIHLEARGAYDWGTGIMRTTDLSDPTSWRAWDGEGYNVQFVDPHNDSGFDPNDHVAKPIAGNGALEKMHQSLTWNTYFNKWMLVGSAQKSGVWGFYYSLSEDLIRWTVRKKIMNANLLINPKHSLNEDVLAYPAIVDHADTSRNFEITGRDVHLYFTRMHPGNTYDRDLVRVPIRFNKLLVDTLVVTGGANKQDATAGDGVCKTAAGKCSFKAAIEESNNRPPWYADSTIYIAFNMDFTELKTINVDAGINSVLYPVFIDGFTQPGASPNTAPFGEPINANYMVELKFDGANSVVGLAFESNRNTVKGLIINGQQGPGLAFDFSDSNTVQGVMINTNNTGTGNANPNNDGMTLTSSSYNLIGDTTAAGRNLILGGIRIKGPDSRENRVEGNYIGTDITGTTNLDQWAAGVTLQDDAQANLIGGTNVKARNLISGNHSNGVQINHSGSSGNKILNNYIGLNAAGTEVIPNYVGVIINGGAEGNYIGMPGAGNIIAGSEDFGIWIDGAPRNFIQGNYIGTDATGLIDFGNTGAGIYLQNNCESLFIGGAGAGEANTIAYNQNGGIVLQVNAGTGIKMWNNAIYKNANGLGIDLGFDDWPNEGDDKDSDTGVNNWQNAPVLISATNGETQINGSLNSTPNTAFRIEFFVSDTCDPSGFGEGQKYLDAMEITTNAAGNATINTTLAKSVEQGKFITATATDPNWNTSEFSNCVTANPFEGILVVTPDYVEKSMEINSTATEDILVSNTGNLAVDWTLSWSNAWISTPQTTSTIQPQTSNNVVLTFDATDLNEGIHRDTVVVSNSNGTQEALKIPVQLTVTATPQLAVSADSLTATLAEGGSLTKSLTITNNGNGSLNWMANTPFDKPWCFIANANGSLNPGQSASFNVQFSAANLNSGTYNSEVAINSNDPDNPLTLIPVSLLVTGTGKIIDVSPAHISAPVVAGDSVESQIFVQNLGTENLTWTATKTQSWLALGNKGSVTMSGAMDTISVHFNSTGLAAAVYQDTVKISSDDPLNPLILVPVEMTVQESAPELWLNSDNFTTTIAQDDSLIFILQIKNAGTGSLNWALTWNAGWIDANPTVGLGLMNAIDTVRIKVKSAGLANATYTDTLQLASLDPNTPVRKIAMQMQVTNELPAIGVSQSSLVATVDEGEGAVHPIAIFNNGTADLQWAMTWNSDWVKPAQTGGVVAAGGAVDFSIVTDGTGLAPGDHADTLLISSNDPNSPVVKVAVWLTITAKNPVMAVSQDNLGSRIPQGTTHEHEIIISNYGTADLQWSAVKNEPWVQPSHNDGTVQPGKEDTMRVVLSAIGLNTGSYSDTLTISSNDPQNSLWLVVISLNVETGNGSLPDIFVQVDTLRAKVALGSKAERSFQIINRGSGILNFTTSTAFFAKWLMIQPQSGSLNPDDSVKVLVKMATDTLALGMHQGAVMVQSNDPDTPHIVVEIMVEVTGAPFITLVPDTVHVAVNSNEKISTTFEIGNIGTADLHWRIDDSAFPEWLIIDHDSGSVSPGISANVKVTVDAANLTGGETYKHVVEIASNDPDKRSIYLEIVLTVHPATGIFTDAQLPVNFLLSQNFPNPFNPGTVIQYALPEQAWVSLKIYDISGRLVYIAVDQLQNTSHYKVKWEGRNATGQPVAAGVYIYKMTARGASGRVFVQTRKMMYLK
ncbi:MAG: T9SS C-terminal target domain-containing protein [Calditrichaeota bacterium]|nr:MAG: T9SS C-terminal target domain-containing protein [Calditrichota bacterium]